MIVYDSLLYAIKPNNSVELTMNKIFLIIACKTFSLSFTSNALKGMIDNHAKFNITYL